MASQGSWDSRFVKSSVIRGHHVYKAIWTPALREELIVKAEDGYVHDERAGCGERRQRCLPYAPFELTYVVFFSWSVVVASSAMFLCHNAPINVMPHPPPLYGDRWGIGGDLTHRMCQIPHPSITIQCQIPTLYIHMRICAGTRANACAGQKPLYICM